MVTQQLRKVGNSYVLTVPKAEVERLDLKEGDYVQMDINRMELKPVLNPDLDEILTKDMPGLVDMLNYLKDR